MASIRHSVTATGANDATKQVSVDAWNGEHVVVLTKADVGLGSADNTADSAKAVLSATKLTTARNIAMSGDVVWSVTFDGSNAVTAAGTIQANAVTFAKFVAATQKALIGANAAGNFQEITLGSGLSLTAGVLSVSGGSGTVTAVSVVTANGVSGTVATSTTTPAITLTLGAITPSSVAATGTVTGSNLSGTNTGDQTSVSGNAGTATKLATGRTIAITGDVTWTSPAFDGSANVTAAATVVKINGVALSGLATGILKNTTTTGLPSIAVAADFPTLNQSTAGSAASLTTGRTIGMTGDVVWTSPAFDGSANVTAAGTIQASAVTLVKMANLAANSIIGNNTGAGATPLALTQAQVLTFLGGTTGTGAIVLTGSPTLATPVINGLPTGTGVAATSTASTLAARDVNKNLLANNFLADYTTTATAAGTTTLTVASTYLQFFTGATTQTVTLPVASTLALGQQFQIVNNSTGAVTVNSSGGNAVIVVAGGTAATVTCILTSGTTAASWSASGWADVATATHGATSKATPVDTDEMPLVDSAASNVLKKLTWANLKATLKTYLDTLYQPVNGALASFTPTWTGVTVGNGTVVAKYVQSGKRVWVRVVFTLGSTSAVTGDAKITLPVTALSATGNLLSLGRARFYDLSLDTAYDGDVHDTDTTHASFRINNVAATYSTAAATSASAPLPWAVGDVLTAQFWYEAA